MIFSSSIIVGAGGVEFVFEVAEEFHFVVDADLGGPLIHRFFPADTLVLRTACFGEFSPVAYVLGISCDPQICLSVVEAVLVDVVGDEAFGDFDDFVVHSY